MWTVRDVTLVVVDGSNLVWRAHHGFPARITTRSGDDVTAVFGFFALLRKALNQLPRPHECVVVFDSEHGWASRQQLHPSYKQHRLAMDHTHLAWLPTIQRGLTQLAIAWQESGEHEADDVIATLAHRARPRLTIVMSTDRDFHQLLRPRVVQLNTTRGVDRRMITDLDVRQRYGVTAGQWCDYIALVGDPSDGIPGVRGIGPIRAAQLLANGSTLDDLSLSRDLRFSHHGRQLAAEMDHVLLWRELARLRIDAPALVPAGLPTPPVSLAATVLEQLGVW